MAFRQFKRWRTGTFGVLRSLVRSGSWKKADHTAQEPHNLGRTVHLVLVIVVDPPDSEAYEAARCLSTIFFS